MLLAHLPFLCFVSQDWILRYNLERLQNNATAAFVGHWSMLNSRVGQLLVMGVRLLSWILRMETRLLHVRRRVIGTGGMRRRSGRRSRRRSRWEWPRMLMR